MLTILLCIALTILIVTTVLVVVHTIIFNGRKGR